MILTKDKPIALGIAPQADDDTAAIEITHTARSGEVIRFPDTPSTRAFWDHLLALFENAAHDADDIFDHLYSIHNPLLDAAPEHGEGAVVLTREAMRSPLWMASRDLLTRKALASAEEMHRKGEPTAYTLSVREAAEMLGIGSRAVRAACEKGTLVAIRNEKATRWLISHASVASYRADHKKRGPQAQSSGDVASCILRVKSGHKSGAKLFFKADGERTITTEDIDEGKGWEGEVVGWTRAGIETSKGRSRFFLLAPKEGAEESFEFEGFFVRGAFEIVEKINNSKEARARMASFHKGER